MNLEALPEVQLFAQNQNVREARDCWVAAMFNGDDQASRLELACRDQCEAVARGITGREDGPRAQIGLLLLVALARRAGGQLAAYRSDLEDAHLYAYHMGFRDLIEALDEALAEPLCG